MTKVTCWAAWIGMIGVFALIPTRSSAAPLVAAPLWQPLVSVWTSQGTTAEPAVVSDASGLTHLFFADEPVKGETRILYHWRTDQDSSVAPTDVLVGVGSGYRFAADPFGLIHILYYGNGGQLFHQSVPGSEADDANAWSAPIPVSTATVGAGFASDHKGGLHVCFPNSTELRYTHSEDGGRNWSDAALVHTTDEPRIAGYSSCAVDTDGVIHVVWSESSPPNYYPAEGMFYSRSSDGGLTWDDPEPIAGEHFALSTLLADAAGNVHLLWQGDVAVGGRYYRVRRAGQDRQWSETETVVPEKIGGMSGDVPMVVDSNGDPSVLTAADGIKWIGRQGAGWSEPVVLSTPLHDLPSQTGSIEQPSLAISGGNQLHAAFEFDFKTIYYTSGLLPVPEKLATPQPLPANRDDSAGEPKRVVTSVAQDLPDQSAPSRNPDAPTPTRDFESMSVATTTGSGWIALGPLLAAMVVGWVVWQHRRSGRR